MKTEQDFVGIHCKACGEGSLQLRDKDQSITHNGIDLVISIKIPTCTICGASLLPKYLRQEVKEKAKAMYKARMENNEIDAGLLYEHVHDFFPSEMATHVDYMAINPLNSRQVKAEEKKNKKIIYRIFRDKNDLNRYITYDCLLFNSTLENKLSQYTPVLNKLEMPHAIYYYVTADEITNNKKPIGITIDEIHLLGVKWDELDTDYLLTRVNTESNVLYVHI